MKTASLPLTILALFLAVMPAAAQPSPFDMTDEAPPAPPVTAPPAPAVQLPAVQAPAVQAPAVQAPADAPQEAPDVEAASLPVDTTARRYLIPFQRLSLPGEMARRSWSVYLTPEQAASASTFNFGYQNAIFVAPESSRLRISINGAVLADEAVASSDRIADISTEVPPGLLKPGYNLLVFETALRHRTDCSISSTYDLWTEIDPARTYLEFDDPMAGLLHRLDDLRAVGVDAAGQTRMTIVVPASEMGPATEPLLKLAQGLGMSASMPNQAVRVVNTPPAALGPGELLVLLGPVVALRAQVPNLPAQASEAAIVDFVPGPTPGTTVLLVSGPAWADVNAGIRQITAPAERSASVSRTVLSYSTWTAPDAPFILGSASIPLAALGVPTTEFSGRRFSTDFTIGIPSDFFAEAYGEARLVLDAAYSEDILPGSQLDVYVNGNIATTVPLGAGAGAILRQLPVNVTMRHFRPGLNRIAIEATLLTEADAVCAPGANVGDRMRFALFDTSRFEVPDFARIGTRPNLPGLSGTGFPYNRSTDPLPVVLDRGNTATLSAAATMLSRISLAAGRIIEIDTTLPIASLANRSAFFINTLPQIPVGVLDAVGVSEQARTSWTESGGQQADTAGTAAAIDRWSSEVGTNWMRPVERLTEWLSDTFNLSFDALRLFPSASGPYMPQQGSSLLMGQGASPEGGGAWLLVSGPTGQQLQDGVERLTNLNGWSEVGGRITTYTPSTDSFTQVPIASFEFVQTQPLSYRNLRLIAANALSENILLYAAMLVLTSIILGVVTTALSRRLGRH